MSDKFPLTVLNEEYGESAYHPLIQPIHSAITTLAEELATPAFETTIIMSGNLTASVDRRGKEKDFSPERLGGQVAGKTFPVDPTDYSRVDVILDVGMMAPDPDGLQQGMFVYLLAHELGHAVIGRQRTTCGDAPTAQRDDPSGMAGVYGLEVVDEWRCDRLADIVLGGMVTAEVVDGEPVPARYGYLVPDSGQAELRQVLDQAVHPAWPELVWSYRVGQTDLASMWEKLQEQTKQVFVCLAHAEAKALGAGQPSPLSQVAGHLGADLYLSPAWSRIMQVVEPQPILSHHSEFHTHQNEVFRVCQSAIAHMWACLGITRRPTDDGRVYLDVTEPME